MKAEAEVERQKAEEIRAAALEADRVRAEEMKAQVEKEKQHAEELKAEAERERVKAEELRAAAAVAEAARAVEMKAAMEKQMAQAEEAKAEAERERLKAEEMNAALEKERERAEVARTRRKSLAPDEVSAQDEKDEAEDAARLKAAEEEAAAVQVAAEEAAARAKAAEEEAAASLVVAQEEEAARAKTAEEEAVKAQAAADEAVGRATAAEEEAAQTQAAAEQDEAARHKAAEEEAANAQAAADEAAARVLEAEHAADQAQAAAEQDEAARHKAAEQAAAEHEAARLQDASHRSKAFEFAKAQQATETAWLQEPATSVESVCRGQKIKREPRHRTNHPGGRPEPQLHKSKSTVESTVVNKAPKIGTVIGDPVELDQVLDTSPRKMNPKATKPLLEMPVPPVPPVTCVEKAADLQTRLAYRQEELQYQLEMLEYMQQEAVIKIQSAARARAAWKESSDRKIKKKHPNSNKHNRAAVRIQSAARGRAARQQLEQAAPPTPLPLYQLIQREWWFTFNHRADIRSKLPMLFDSSLSASNKKDVTDEERKYGFMAPRKGFMAPQKKKALEPEQASIMIQARWRGCRDRCYVQQVMWLLAEKTIALRHRIVTSRHERTHRMQQRRKAQRQTQGQRRAAGIYGSSTARPQLKGNLFEPSERRRQHAWEASPKQPSNSAVPSFMDFGKVAAPLHRAFEEPPEPSVGHNMHQIYNLGVRTIDLERYKQLVPLNGRSSAPSSPAHSAPTTPTSTTPNIESKYAPLPDIRAMQQYRYMYTVIVLNVPQNAGRAHKILCKQSWMFKESIHTTCAADESLQLHHHLRFENAQAHVQRIVAEAEAPAHPMPPVQPPSPGHHTKDKRPSSWEGPNSSYVHLESDFVGESTTATQTIFTPGPSQAPSRCSDMQQPRPPASPKTGFSRPSSKEASKGNVVAYEASYTRLQTSQQPKQ